MAKVLILKNGGGLTPSKAAEILHDNRANGKTLSRQQQKFMGWKAGQKAANGATIEPISGKTVQYNGPSHEDGGIDISHAGTPVNVEGQEMGHYGEDGSLSILGNLQNPLTGRKFKEDSKTLAKKGAKAETLMDKGNKLMLDSDPEDKWGSLAYNSGMIMAIGARKKAQEIEDSQNHLAILQKAMLDRSKELGMDPQEFSKGNLKAKKGLTIYSDGGTQDGPGKKAIPAGANPANWEKRADGLYYDKTLLSNDANVHPTNNAQSPQYSPMQTNFSDRRSYTSTTKNSYQNVLPANNRVTFPTVQSNGQTPASSTGILDASTLDSLIQKNKASVQAVPNTTQSNNDGTQPLSLAERNNNPGNIMFGKWAASHGGVQGDPRYKNGKLVGYYTKFPDANTGDQAMQSLLKSAGYANLTVEQASKKWTGEGAYATITPDIAGIKIKDLSPDQWNKTVGAFKQGEGDKHYNSATTTVTNPDISRLVGNNKFTPWNTNQFKIPDNPLPTYNPTKVQGDNTPMTITEPKDYPVQGNQRPLSLNQITPELYAAATNHQVPVWMQKYSPQLFEPYQVSFQDKLNENQANFNASRKAVAYDPTSLSTLAGQEYSADSGVLAEEFRTNQGINNEIINKNKALLNDATQENLKLADLQYTRQSEARSKTKETNQAILSSISDKVSQNILENRTLGVYQNLYPHFRFDPNTGQEIKQGAPGQDYINWNGDTSTTQNNGNQAVKQVYDPRTGQTKAITTTTPGPLTTALKSLQYRKNTISLMKAMSNQRGQMSNSFGYTKDRD